MIEVYKDYIILSWDDPEFDGGNPITGYLIEKSLSGGMFVSGGQTKVGITEHKVSLMCGFYYICIYRVCTPCILHMTHTILLHVK